MEKIRREMVDYGYVERYPEEIMAEDAARDINSWRPGSGVKPLSPEKQRKLQRQMYREANKPIPYWLKRNFKPNPKRIVASRARRRARDAVRNAGAAATKRVKVFFGKGRGGRRKKTRKKRRKAKRTRKKRRKRRK